MGMAFICHLKLDIISYQTYNMTVSIKKILFSTFLAFTLFFVVNHEAQASEGTVDLVGNNVECYGMSVETYSNQFSILLRCENVVYPPSDTGILYYVWVTNLNNSKPIRLGSLDFGRASYKASSPFKDMYVTIEGKKNPTSPSGEIVMTGKMKGFQFDNITSKQPTTITPPPSNGQVTDEDMAAQIDKQSEGSTSFLANATSFLLRAGIIVLVVIAIVGIILFVISKLR
jgi:hypothetical protein